MMFQWLATYGANLREPLPGSTNYLGAYNAQGRLKRVVTQQQSQSKAKRDKNEGSANEGDQSSTERKSDSKEDEGLPPETPADLHPFPQNRNFMSQQVLSEELREAIWEKIMKDGQSVQMVSAELGVEMNRVGAVVRLKEVEKEWMRKGKRLAKPYAKAVMEMLPKTPYEPNKGDQNRSQKPHESINDLPVHAATTQQIFHPTSESRHFTRADAAKVFDDMLLPADQRVPHPELADLERDRLAGLPYNERIVKDTERRAAEQQKKLVAEQRRKFREQKAVKKVDDGGRWEFRFREINVDDAGADGRGHRGTGWRYGVPHMDRRRNELKIPKNVA